MPPNECVTLVPSAWRRAPPSTKAAWFASNRRSYTERPRAGAVADVPAPGDAGVPRLERALFWLTGAQALDFDALRPCAPRRPSLTSARGEWTQSWSRC